MKLSDLLARGVAAAISTALIACADPVEPQPDPEAAAQIGEAETIPHTLPPPGETPRYVGLWATTTEGCSQPAWRFQERHVSTLGEVSCDFNTVNITSSGYDIAASCTEQAPPAPYQIQLSFAESARAMMISGGPWQGATSLVYCGTLPQE